MLNKMPTSSAASYRANRSKTKPNLLQVRFWDGASLAPGKAFRQEWTVESASFCPAKGRFAAGGEDMWVHLYDYATGEELECNKGTAWGLSAEGCCLPLRSGLVPSCPSHWQHLICQR